MSRLAKMKTALRHAGLPVIGLSLLSVAQTATAETFNLEEATIDEVDHALDLGVLSAVELAALYLNRIAAYDRHGPDLNSIPLLNPNFLEEASAADAIRLAGGDEPLLGIPFTTKDSYKVEGLPVASGSPAFANMIANEDAFTIDTIRKAGGILVGKTNMPPLAEGGMEKGLYGRAESPYNPDYLTAAWRSGSSNGSATSTTANFAVFGMGEETVSSGRSPASNNALIAYTPSRGMLSIRGNWPLYPVRDVVVPHTRSVEDMLRLLDVIQVTDPVTVGDFWRDQDAVVLPRVEDVRPEDMMSLAKTGVLRGKRIGVPKMYIGAGDQGERPIEVRPSILALWQKTADDLRAMGAEVVEVDFPVMHRYEVDQDGIEGPVERGIMPEGWFRVWRPGAEPGVSYEWEYVNPYMLEQFVRLNGDPNLSSWTEIDPDMVFPSEPGAPEARNFEGNRDRKEAIARGLPEPADLPGFAEALQAAETLRKVDFEDWMDELGLDLVVFPSAADIGKADANKNQESYDDAMRNGVYFSNMNGTIRHLGIPSVSVPMGLASDIGMPVNLTFIGKAYTDPELLSYAYDFEQATQNRQVPGRTPPLPDEVITFEAADLVPPAVRADKTPPSVGIRVPAMFVTGSGAAHLPIAVSAWDDEGLAEVRVYVNGQRIPVSAQDGYVADYQVPADGLEDSDMMVLALAKDTSGNADATLIHYSVSSSGAVTRLDSAPLPECEICG